ncbi:MAG: hypothetical protein MN733_22170 [Nitrososphaera sp.]|nr:hypothetical protein [Nitrososphaera sp.]
MRDFVKQLVRFAFSLPAAACRLTNAVALAVTKLVAQASSAVCDLGDSATSKTELIVLQFIDEVFDAVDRLRGTLK